MTYWQELRREWSGSAVVGGIMSWMCFVFITCSDQSNVWRENAFAFMLIWPIMFAVDVGEVWIKRRFRK